MDVKIEFDKIKSTLENAQGWGSISSETRKIVQEKFKSLLDLIDEQQKIIAKQNEDEKQ